MSDKGAAAAAAKAQAPTGIMGPLTDIGGEQNWINANTIARFTQAQHEPEKTIVYFIGGGSVQLKITPSAFRSQLSDATV